MRGGCSPHRFFFAVVPAKAEIEFRQWSAVASCFIATWPLTQRAFRSSADDAKLVPWNTAGSSERFATRPRGEDLKQASLRFPTGVENSPRNGIVFLFCLGFVH
ncbi:hypothetical protein DyAD56_01025 [Dyella sp. AD56]|nr:hypothetical protein DyAD56_01025 [Dyella sp. AD56]